MSGRPDVVFLTIDCWRYDAVTQMHRLRAMASESLDRGEAICQSAATPGVFPAILGSTYYSSAYDESGALDHGPTLPALLSDAGYETGAVVANNPFLEKFRDEFDHFWNGGSGTGEYRRVYHYARRRLRRTVRRRSSVSAPDVADHAREWFRSTSGPRFLLMHLMDPHEPYYPGLKRWLGVGPLRARRALAQFSEDRLAMTDTQRATIERLYRGCVEFVDAHVRSLLSFVPDDALVVVVGDHGEEFEHGAYRHARLYDECVRVPLFTRNLPEVAATDRVRQLDLPPSVLRHVDATPPDEWDGRPCDGTNRDSFMLNHSPHRGESYLGLRTDRYKLMRTVDHDRSTHLDTELYDLATDPRETRDLAETERGAARVDQLSERLTAFVDENDVEAGIDRGTGSHPESGAPEERLEALGYV
ncbi:sulfatase-like hydrolase/transferase [Halorientalis marina]|uniref:sulfatase-like hydrolase/transferase n=1 Tax=Halorientalis marina TaxID=2931976 RepID=UPI001FF3AFEF|nr:sulfatase-like hydrolase/transferase [Halorientalis marina]